jgi:hypothetical protein
MTTAKNEELLEATYDKWMTAGSIQGNVAAIRAYLTSANLQLTQAIEKSEEGSKGCEELQELAKSLQVVRDKAAVAFTNWDATSETLLTEYATLANDDEA